MVWNDFKNVILLVLSVVVIVLILRNPAEATGKTARSCFTVQGKCVETGEACPTDYFVNTDYYCVGETRACCVPTLLLGREPTEEEGKGGQPTPAELGKEGILEAEALKNEGKFEEANAAYKTIIESSTATVEDKVKAAFMAGLLYFKIRDGYTTYVGTDGADTVRDAVGQMCENFIAIRTSYPDVVDEENFLGADLQDGSNVKYVDEAKCIVEELGEDLEGREAISQELTTRNKCGFLVDNKAFCIAKFPALHYFAEEPVQPIPQEQEQILEGEELFMLYQTARNNEIYEEMCDHASTLIREHYDECVELFPETEGDYYVTYGEIVPCDLYQFMFQNPPEYSRPTDCVDAVNYARDHHHFTETACEDHPLSNSRACPTAEQPVG